MDAEYSSSGRALAHKRGLWFLLAETEAIGELPGQGNGIKCPPEIRGNELWKEIVCLASRSDGFLFEFCLRGDVKLLRLAEGLATQKENWDITGPRRISQDGGRRNCGSTLADVSLGRSQRDWSLGSPLP